MGMLFFSLLPSRLNSLGVALNLDRSADPKSFAESASLNGINRKVSINLIVKALLIYFENKINFSSVLGITVVVWGSYPNSVIIKFAP